MALLDKLISDVRVEVGDTAKERWQNDEIIRAIEKTVSLMSRLIPNKASVEIEVTDDKGGGTQRLDISGDLPNFIRVERLEYPYNQTPPTLPAFNLIGKTIYLTGTDKFLTGRYARVIYICHWTPPTPTATGSYPIHLNDAVVIGASGQALIFKAEHFVNVAATTLANASTVLSGSDLSTVLTAVGTALDSAKTSFAASIATLGSLSTPQGSANTALGKVAAEVAAGKAYLETGDDFINSPNRGDKVGATYAQYAEEQLRLAGAYKEEADGYLTLVNSYIEKATRESIAGTGYTTEAAQRVAHVDRLLVQSERNEAIAVHYLEVAGRYLASGQSKINEFLAALGFKPELAAAKISPLQPSY